jgi:hypothetical protein
MLTWDDALAIVRATIADHEKQLVAFEAMRREHLARSPYGSRPIYLSDPTGDLVGARIVLARLEKAAAEQGGGR